MIASIPPDVLGSTIGGLILLFIAWAARWVVKAAKVVIPVFKGWQEAGTLEHLGMANNASLRRIEQQLGTGSRQPSWDPLEDYIHSLSHDFRGEFAGLRVVMATVERTASLVRTCTESLDRATAQLVSHTNQKGSNE